MAPHLLRMLVLAALCGRLLAAAPQLWSQGDPTPEEQYTLEWLNAARADPVGTLDRAIAAAPGDAALAAFFAAQPPPAQLTAALQAALAVAQANAIASPGAAAISQGPLVFYPAFQAEAALASAQAALPAPEFPPGRSPPSFLVPPPIADRLLSGPANAFSGPDATGGTASFGPYGATYSEISQANLYDPSLSGREYVLSLLCAPGSGSPPPSFLVQGDPLPDLTLGHTRMAGIDLSAAAGGGRILTFYRGSNEFFTTSDLPFTPAGTVFITGVAYADLNGNGAYDPGEGIAGVNVTLDHGPWAATTASAGGYAIPVPANSGAYTATAVGGPFSGATATVTVGGDNVTLDWVAPPPPPTLPLQQTVPGSSGSAQLANLSARGLVQTGSDALIAGFVISGPAGARKRLLIRGVGPTLATLGLPASACVPATQLQIVSSSQSILGSNAGWLSAPDAGAAAAAAAYQCGAFPLVAWAGGGGDSALVVSLAPGAYTVLVAPAPGAPAGDQTGLIGLVEVYDLTPGDGSRLINLSCRAAMGPGLQALALGVSVGGGGAERLLVRGAGPALAGFGLTPVLAHPSLSLANAAGETLATNAGWSDCAQTLQIASLSASSGAFPFPAQSADAALVAAVGPGTYTASLAAAPGSAANGCALIEAYEAP